MKFKVDENLPTEVADLLGTAGHPAATVADEGLSGSSDDQVLQACLHEQRILVTMDLDFANVRSYPPRDYPGFVVLRLTRQEKKNVLAALQRILPLLQEDKLAHRLWIVEEDRVRIRSADED